MSDALLTRTTRKTASARLEPVLCQAELWSAFHEHVDATHLRKLKNSQDLRYQLVIENMRGLSSFWIWVVWSPSLPTLTAPQPPL